MASTTTMATTPQILNTKTHTPSTYVATGGNVNTYLPDNVMVYQLSSNSMPNASKIKIQNIISVGGENSSAYESSEDTGVGELSESELMTAQDGIGMFYLPLIHLSISIFFPHKILKKKNSISQYSSTVFDRINSIFLHSEIPLGDARLLEEHDLTNVLNQLPVDAFNDLFQGKKTNKQMKYIKSEWFQTKDEPKKKEKETHKKCIYL